MMRRSLRHAPGSILLQVFILAAFLFVGTAALPAHDHHDFLDLDHPCLVCHLVTAPADLSWIGAAGAVAMASADSRPLPEGVDVLRQHEEPARSSHPLRGPPAA